MILADDPDGEAFCAAKAEQGSSGRVKKTRAPKNFIAEIPHDNANADEPIIRPSTWLSVRAKPENCVFEEPILYCAGEDFVSMAHVDIEHVEARIGPNDRAIAARDRVF